MISGQKVCGGSIEGRVAIVRERKDIFGVEDGDIVVVPHSHPSYSLAVMKAGGLVCETGGRLSHLCIVALEMGIPCITSAEHATERLHSGMLARLNADEGEVYEATSG